MALTRGPFIQSMSRRDAFIVWYTNTVEDSVVQLGSTVGNYNMIFRNTVPVNVFPFCSVDGNDTAYKHVVKVSGLASNTKYFYTIGNNNNVIQGNSDNFFWTMPDKFDNSTTKRIWAVADTDTGGLNQTRDSFLIFNGTTTTQEGTKINAMITVGDNVYDNDGLYVDYNDLFFAATTNNYFSRVLKRYNLFTETGNHDYLLNTGNVLPMSNPYYTIFNIPQLTECGGVASFKPRFYSFDIGDVHFIGLDVFLPSESNVAGVQWSWLRNDLENAKKQISLGKTKWVIVFVHYPPFSESSSHSTFNNTSREGSIFRDRMLPLIHRYNVDLVLYGHVHAYQRSLFLHDFNGPNGFSLTNNVWAPYRTVGSAAYFGRGPSYDKITYSGTVHAAQGHGGASFYQLPGNYGGLNCVGVVNEYGSGVIDITPGAGISGSDRLTYRMVSSLNSSTVRDTFYIDK